MYFLKLFIVRRGGSGVNLFQRMGPWCLIVDLLKLVLTLLTWSLLADLVLYWCIYQHVSCTVYMYSDFQCLLSYNGTDRTLTLLLLVPFSYKSMHHLKPFAIVVLNGEITVYSIDSPNGFEWCRSANIKPCLDLSKLVVQLIQNLVWILLSGESMDPPKPFEWIDW